MCWPTDRPVRVRSATALRVWQPLPPLWRAQCGLQIAMCDYSPFRCSLIQFPHKGRQRACGAHLPRYVSITPRQIVVAKLLQSILADFCWIVGAIICNLLRKTEAPASHDGARVGRNLHRFRRFTRASNVSQAKNMGLSGTCRRFLGNNSATPIRSSPAA